MKLAMLSHRCIRLYRGHRGYNWIGPFRHWSKSESFLGQSSCAPLVSRPISYLYPGENASNARFSMLLRSTGHRWAPGNARHVTHVANRGSHVLLLNDEEHGEEGVDFEKGGHGAWEAPDEPVGDPELSAWHEKKQIEYDQLLGRSLEVTRSTDPGAILAVMKEWNEFSRSISLELPSLHAFRRSHPFYPPSALVSRVTYGAALESQPLLRLLLSSPSSSSEVQLEAYRTIMDTLSHAHHGQAGDDCADVLEEWGARHNGDMARMPGIEAYNVVAMAHVRSCPSFFLDAHSQSPAVATPGKKAASMLRLLSDAHSAGDLFLKPNVDTYSYTIAALRHTLLDWKLRRRASFSMAIEPHSEAELATEAMLALHKMEALLTNQMHDKPSLRHWHSIIRAYGDAIAILSHLPSSKIIHSTTNVTPLRLLQQLEQYASIMSSHLPSTNTTQTDDALLQDTQRIISEAYADAISSRLNNLRHNDEIFQNANEALDNARQSEDIFQRMKQRYDQSPMTSEPESKSYSYLYPLPTSRHYLVLIQNWVHCLHKQYSTLDSNPFVVHDQGVDDGETLSMPILKAEYLLNELEQQLESSTSSSSSGQEIPMKGSIHCNILWAYTQTPHWKEIHSSPLSNIDFVDNAERLLYRTLNIYPSLKGYIVTRMFNLVFSLHSKLRGQRAISKSMNLLDVMEDYYRDHHAGKPNNRTFGMLLKIISNNGGKKAGERADEVLNRMMNGFGMLPKQDHYLTAMTAHNRTRRKDDGAVDVNKLESILDNVKRRYYEDGSVKPITAMYSVCITAHARSSSHRDNAKKAMELLNELEDFYSSTNDPDFRPDAVIYGAVLDAVSKSNAGSNMAPQALNLLNRMEDMYNSGQDNMKPDRYAYTSALHAISRSSNYGHGVEMAETLLRRMDERFRHTEDESIRPDTVTFTTLLQILSRAKYHPDALGRALSWFQEMQNRHEQGDLRCKPNKITYTALINCWWKSGRPNAGEEAEKVLNVMERKYEDDRDFDCKPDSFAYGSTINAWGRSHSKDKAIRAWRLYCRMKEQYSNGNLQLRPNAVILTSIMNTCGYSPINNINEQQMTLKILLECLTEIKTAKYITPNPIVFRTALDSIRQIVSDERKRRPLSSTVFEMCCRTGQLDESVLMALNNAQPCLYEQLPFVTSNGNILKEEIPHDWTRNVVKKNRSK